MKKAEKSQRELVLEHLMRVGSITPMEALSEYGCFRLASVIWDLREAGYPIDTNYPDEGKRYAIYTMEKGAGARW